MLIYYKFNVDKYNMVNIVCNITGVFVRGYFVYEEFQLIIILFLSCLRRWGHYRVKLYRISLLTSFILVINLILFIF